jgi:hypothetical protein
MVGISPRDGSEGGAEIVVLNVEGGAHSNDAPQCGIDQVYAAARAGGREGGGGEEERGRKGIRWRDEVHGTLEEDGRGIAGEESFYVRVHAMRQQAKTARLLMSLLLMAFVCPFLLLGPQIGKVLPGMVPDERWSFTALGLGQHPKALPSLAAGGAKPNDAAGSKQGEAGAAAAEAVSPQPTSPVEVSSWVLAQGMKLKEGINDDAPKSIWSFGPFVMFAGVVLSLLAKLLLAQPCAKVCSAFHLPPLHPSIFALSISPAPNLSLTHIPLSLSDSVGVSLQLFSLRLSLFSTHSLSFTPPIPPNFTRHLNPKSLQVSTDALRNLMKAQLEAQGEERPDLEQGYHERQVLKKEENYTGSRRAASSTTPRSGASTGSGKWKVEIDIPGDPRDAVRASGRSSGAVSRSSSGGGGALHPKVVAAIESGDGKSPFGSLLQEEVRKSPMPSPRNGPGQ